MSVRMSADVTGLFEAMGVIDGITRSLESNAFADAILNEAIGEMKIRFMTNFAAMSISNPQKYHHVWEWGQIGSNPLFFLHRSGRGKEKSVGFGFRQSLKAVPKPDPQTTGIDREHIAKLKSRAIFRFKAIIMETGTEVTIRPNRANVLFVPMKGAKDKNGNVVNFIFAKEVKLKNVGGKEATGAFSTFWTGWWETSAPDIIDEHVIPELEKELGSVANSQLSKIRRGKATSTKTFTMVPVGAMERAKQLRAQATESEISRYASSFSHDEMDEE